MKNPTINQLLNTADEKLFWAEDEFNKPTTDIVGMCVCLNVKEVMSNYLQAFSIYNDKPEHSIITLNDLLEECVSLDKDFENIDLSVFMCKNENVENESRYCIAHDKTKECLAIARMTREIVIKKLNKVD